jgi:hypothetical protein
MQKVSYGNLSHFFLKVAGVNSQPVKLYNERPIDEAMHEKKPTVIADCRPEMEEIFYECEIVGPLCCF